VLEYEWQQLLVNGRRTAADRGEREGTKWFQQMEGLLRRTIARLPLQPKLRTRRMRSGGVKVKQCRMEGQKMA
jgi:hypothetical protein